MRRIERTKTFKKDYQRAVATPKHRDLANLLPAVIALLAADTPLPEKYVDHPLRGEWKDFRDCHVKPDLVLIYRKSGTDILQLVRLGSSSSGRAVRASLHSLDEGGPEACRDASAPASLRSSPHFPVRSFERVALTRSASRISAKAALRSVATSCRN
jgi:mRNA interferase YafQ